LKHWRPSKHIYHPKSKNNKSHLYFLLLYDGLE
jgi:hypothetical protein